MKLQSLVAIMHINKSIIAHFWPIRVKQYQGVTIVEMTLLMSPLWTVSCHKSISKETETQFFITLKRYSKYMKLEHKTTIST